MAVETQVSPTPDVAQAATPVTQEPVSSDNGTAEHSDGNGVTGEAQPAEEQFGGVDIKSLPKEIQTLLKEKHDAMLRDYKDKTTKVAEERKKLEPLSKKAEALDQLLQDQEFVNWWKAKNNPESAEPPQELTKEQILEQKIQQIETELIEKESINAVNTFAEEVDEKGQKLRPDFEELANEGLISGYLQLNPPKTKKEFNDKLNEAYTWSKTMATKFKEAGRKQAYEEMQKKAAISTLPPQTGAKGVYDGPDPKTIDAATAVALARKGVRVPKY